MKPLVTRRVSLVVLLEAAYFLCIVHVAASPAGASIPPPVTAIALALGCLLIPVVAMLAKSARVGRVLMRSVGALLACSGVLALLAATQSPFRDAGVVALGMALLVLPLSLRDVESG